MSQRLLDYLNMMDGSPGCVTRYENQIVGGHSPEHARIYISGWYAGVLDELIAMIGRDKVHRLVVAHIDLEPSDDDATTP